MPTYTFRRGRRFIIDSGEQAGKLIEYIRRKQNTRLLVFKDLSGDMGEMYLSADSLPQLRNAPNKKSNAQGARLILCHCEQCGLKIRTTPNWLRNGNKPRCFNKQCETWTPRAGGVELVIEWGERGDGVLDFDKRLNTQQANEAMGRTPFDPRDDSPDDGTPDYVPDQHDDSETFPWDCDLSLGWEINDAEG